MPSENTVGEGTENVQEAMRWLLLPVPVDGEDEAVEAAAEELHSLGVELEDISAWVRLEQELWQASGSPSDGLMAVVGAYLEAGDQELGPLLQSVYFPLHRRLTEESTVSHATASAILSHARLMALLASEESLSAAQIAKLISARDQRSAITWQHVKFILAELNLAPRLRLPEVEALYESDEGLEVELFADADELACAELVAEIGRKLGFPGSLIDPLVDLLPPDGSPYGPYLQMLHYQCVVAEFYDHSLSAIYEFNPRGQTPDWIFTQYPSSLEVAGNPFLNNAKSVDRLSAAWARSKKRAQSRQAHALVAIINGLDSLGYSARRELAAWLRRLLVRHIRIAKGYEVELPEALTKAQALKVLRRVAAGETGTRGILEQRVVDAAASLRHPSPEWLPRGLLDSVNATNISKRKCGDCDFQNASESSVAAYEAHAGTLTDLYVRGHMRTLEGVISARSKEWAENVAPDLEWEVTVTFIAHNLQVSEWPERTIANARVRIEATDYATFLADLLAKGTPSSQQAVNTYVRAPLAAPRTPATVRRTLLDILDLE